MIESSNLSADEKNFAISELDKVRNEVINGKIAGFRMKIRGIHAPAYGGQSGGRQTQMQNNGFTIIRLHGKKMKRDVIESSVGNSKGLIHPAIYPHSIIEEIIKLLTPTGGLVLDPFMGSGSTAIACINTNRNYMGFEINPDYYKESLNRIERYTKEN